MRLTFNRMLALAALAATGLMAGCSTDSPSPTQNKPPGGNGGLSIQLSTTNSTPKAGACTIIQAFATQNGSAVPDGSSIQFTTLGGAFAQNGDVAVSIVTQSGAAFVTLCADSEGTATVKGKITIGNNSAQGSIPIQFISNGLPSGPFISICANPHAGPVSGNTTVDIKGGGFGTTASAVKVLFKSGGVTHIGVVTAVTDSDITVITPAFPELVGLGATSVEVDVILPGNTVLVSQNCYTYTSSVSFISVCATPGNGPITGGTNVQIQGGGFGTDPSQVTVSFRIGSTTLPAVVTAVTDTSINVITPAFSGLDPSATSVADIVVKVGAQTTLTSSSCFTYTQTGLTPVVSSLLPSSGTKLGGTRVTIFGTGFSSPVQVFFGGVQAEVVSVSFNKIVVITPPLPGGQTPGPVTVTVKNATCTVSGAPCTSNGVSFTYSVPLQIFSFSPDHGDSSTIITIFGQGFVDGAIVTIGGVQAPVVSITGTQILIRPPAGCASSGVICVTLTQNGETACSSAPFSGSHPVVATGPTPSTGALGTTTAVTVTGSDFFPASTAGTVTSANTIANVTGGAVVITSATEFNGTQTLKLNITPDCTSSSVTFQIRNNATGCLSDVLTFTVPGVATITSGAPTPATGPNGVATISTVSGTNLFPTGTSGAVNSSAVNVVGGTVTVIGSSESGGSQTLQLSITPTASCNTQLVTFSIRNNVTSCTSAPVSFTGTGNGPLVTAGPTPASGNAGATTSVSVSGTNFAPTSDLTQSSIVNSSGGTVTITSRTQSGGTQTFLIDITPTVSGCASAFVTFQIKNTQNNCVSDPISFAVNGGAPAITSGPTPNTGVIGVATTTTIVGRNFFPTGQPTQVDLQNVTGGTASITGTSEAGDGTQTLTLSVTPAPVGCNTTTTVTFNIRNKITLCLSGLVTFTGTGGGITASQPTPSSGPAGVTTAVKVTGTGLFQSGNGSTAQVSGVPVGGTVIITGTSEDSVTHIQTVNLNITPTAGCGAGSVTFRLVNSANPTCISGPIVFNVTGTTPTILTGPVPNVGPSTAFTDVTFTGLNFFPSGDPSQASVGSVLNGTVLILSASEDGTTHVQTVVVRITPTKCDGTPVTFKFVDGSCSTNTVTFNVNPISVITGPTPSSGPATSPSSVTVVGTGFFPTGNPAAATITSPTGGTVTITGAQDNTPSTGQQTLTLTILPTDCATVAVTFKITNTAGACTSNLISFIVNGLIVTSGPTPTNGPAGVTTSVTVSGKNFFPSGNPAAVSIVNVVGGTVTITNAVDSGGGNDTLTLAITPTSSCSSGSVTFQIRNTVTSCTSATLSFFSVGAVAVTSGPSPSSGPEFVTTTGVTISGTGFWTNNPSEASITGATGGTVVITGSSQVGPTQTLTLSITPNISCAGAPVTFAIRNNFVGCTSQTVTFNGTPAVVVNQAPNPAGGPAGASTIVTITGTGFFPSGNPAAASVTGVSGGSATIVNATEAVNGTETLQLSIIPNVCASDVTFQIRNTVIGCNSIPLFFNNTSFVALAASFAQAPGGGGSEQITFTNTTTGGVPPFACLWTAGGNNAGSPAISPSATTCSPVTVTWDCDAGTPCISSPFIELRVTDNCGVISDTGPVLVTPP